MVLLYSIKQGLLQNQLINLNKAKKTKDQIGHFWKIKRSLTNDIYNAPFKTRYFASTPFHSKLYFSF